MQAIEKGITTENTFYKDLHSSGIVNNYNNNNNMLVQHNINYCFLLQISGFPTSKIFLKMFSSDHFQ